MTVRVRHNRAAYYDLRSEPGVRADLEARGKRVFDAAGGTAAGYALDSRQGAKRPQGRWRVSVAAVTVMAKRSNARHNTLLRSLGAGRG